MIVANVVMIILAVRNLRLRRSDVWGAVRVALLMAGLEFIIEVLAIRIHEHSLLGHVQSFFGDQAGGHVALHGVELFIAYLAIEPYLRRLWPRVLVGTMRLVSGRVTDPLVGREILIGSLVGIGLPTVIWLVASVTIDAPEWVTRANARPLTSVSQQVIGNLLALAWGINFTVTFAILMVFGRRTRRREAAQAAATVSSR